MSIQMMVGLGFTLSIFLAVLTVGMATTRADLEFVLGRPARLFRTLLAINVLGPTIAVIVCKTFSLHPAVIVGLVTLSLAPIGALFAQNVLPLVTPGRGAYIRGVFVVSTLLSVILTPLAVEVVQLFGSGEGPAVHLSPLAVGKVVVGSVLLPLGAGFVIGKRWPGAKSWIPALRQTSSILLLACAVPVLVAAWPHLGPLVREGTLTAIAVIALAGLAAGHLLGGPDEDHRTVLAFATVSRHPGVAMAIAGMTGEPLAPAGVLLALLVSEIATTPYKLWRKRLRAAGIGTTGPNPPATGAH